LPVYGNDIAGACGLAQCGCRIIQAYIARGNAFLNGAPGAEAGGGHDLLQSFPGREGRASPAA
jgi:hypothetical protein